MVRQLEIIGLQLKTYKARNPNSKDKPWLVLDLFPGKKVPAIENQEVQYLSVPIGPTLDQDWKNLQLFLQTKTGFDQVLSGWMTSTNAFGVAASQIARIFCSSKFFIARNLTISERTLVVQGSYAQKAVGHILLASVAQIMVDPHYRTIEGFAMLVEKDWLSFRYPFFGMAVHW